MEDDEELEEDFSEDVEDEEELEEVEDIFRDEVEDCREVEADEEVDMLREVLDDFRLEETLASQQ